MRDPNIVIIMTDQHQAAACAREGFGLDTTPFLDHLAHQGVWFNRAYTTAPMCMPARISMLTGRFPSAHRVRVNHHKQYALYERDLIDVCCERGYATALMGKNHSHLCPDRLDHWFELSHEGGSGPARTPGEKAMDAWLTELRHGVALTPSPFPAECQCPYRAVSDAQEWIRSLKGSRFFLWLSFPEPHSPYQVSEPYFSMFPPDDLPPVLAGGDTLEKKSFKWQWTKRLGAHVYPDYQDLLPRVRASYYGMLRLIDDQVRRFVAFLQAEGLWENTLLLFAADHGDFVGEYGMMRKGPEMPEVLVRIPLFVVGPGVRSLDIPHPAHVSLVDVFPTLCEAIGVPLPAGVQGRSLWPLLTGRSYPQEEFADVYVEQGFGGLHHTKEDCGDWDNGPAPGLKPGPTFDCLNSCTQSGTLRMLRSGDWKLTFDMQGHGELYDLARDPSELENLYDQSGYEDVRHRMVTGLLMRVLQAQDPLPLPTKYEMKMDPRNYWAPYRREAQNAHRISPKPGKAF